MKLKLTDNPNLVLKKDDAARTLPSTVSDNFMLKAHGLMITGCPNVSALKVLNDVKAYKAANPTVQNYKALTNIRLQLDPHRVGSTDTFTYGCTGTYDTLYDFATFGNGTLSGYGNDGAERKKAGLIGTWTITDYIDDEMAEALSGANGRYVVADDELQISSDYHIDWNDIAVQTLDPTKPNYNPAVAVILNSKEYGDSHDNTQHFTGKWWMTKDEAATIRSIGTWFASVSSVVDTEGIVSTDTTAVYPFTNFDAFSGFVGVSAIRDKAFGNDLNLSSVRFPDSLTSIPSFLFKGSSEVASVGRLPDSIRSIQMSAFEGCSSLSECSLGNGVREIEQNAFNGCGSVEIESFPSSLRYVSNAAFRGCSSMTASDLPPSVGFIGTDAFNGCSAMDTVHIGAFNTKVNVLSGAFEGAASTAIYVGTEDSSVLSEALIRKYASDGNTASYSARLSSWYPKAMSERVGSGYEVQRYIVSDGSSFVDTGFDYTDGTRFEADVSFCAATGSYVHGSASKGLSASTDDGGVKASFAEGVASTLNGRFSDGYAHSYSIDLSSSKFTLDGNTVFAGTSATSGDNSGITLFGSSEGSFVGRGWSARITKDGEVESELVPARNGNTLGFYDVKGRTFIAVGSGFASDTVVLMPSADGSGSLLTEDGLEIEF